jgi:Ca2+-binding RTX toxin-like protein
LNLFYSQEDSKRRDCPGDFFRVSEEETMTVHNITTNSSAGFVTLDDADRWVVAAGVTVDVADDNAFFGVRSFTRCSFVVKGTVETTGNYHTFLLKADRTNVTVDSTGLVQSAKDAIHMLGDTSKVFNYGTIDAASFGVRFYGDDSDLLNNGTITSDNTAVSFSGLRGEAENHGTIEGRVGLSVNTEDGRFDLLNTGTIEGSKYAYVGNAANERITNSGEFIGDVYLRSGWDTFTSNGGTVTGSVFGGTGNDTFRIGADKIKIVELQGGGIDRVFATASYDLTANVENLTFSGNVISAGHGNRIANEITGSRVANSLWGMGGDDTINSGAGNDSVRGGSGRDHIDGGRNADTLHGGNGRDFINGSTGRDTIYGDHGRDMLTGGASRDTFVFKDGHGIDQVTDFTARGGHHDVLDLSALAEIASFRDLKLHHMQQVGADVVISDDSGHIILSNVDKADLTRHDFLL